MRGVHHLPLRTEPDPVDADKGGDKEDQNTARAQRGQGETCSLDLHWNCVVCRMLWSPD